MNANADSESFDSCGESTVISGSRSWWELAQNARAITSLYTLPPELQGVEVHSIHLHRDGAILKLSVELPRYPDRPSPRWPATANTVQAVFTFLDLRRVTLS